MMRGVFILFLVSFLFISCGTNGSQNQAAQEGQDSKENALAAAPAPQIEKEQEPVPPPLPPVAVFNPENVDPQLKESVKHDIVDFIAQLNRIIRSRDYNKWVSFLDKDYYELINTPDFLERISKTDFLKAKNIVLHSPQDYFFNVVVQSRNNDRVDDISFVSENRIKVYTKRNGQKLRLYDLEKLDDGWIIIN